MIDDKGQIARTKDPEVHLPMMDVSDDPHARNCNSLFVPSCLKFFDTTGNYLQLPYYAQEGHKTPGNWYANLLNAHGNPIKHYGDLDLGKLSEKMDRQGAISRFIG